ncbi:MAG: hypothetical protein JWP38_305 [Herbaspirillum sp.]|jgi:hypothetical protein|nr:hypothetical protein [Herbaspirillum sp.]
MYVALPAVVIFLILLPGFLFRSKFKRVEQTSLDYSPFGQVVLEAASWAAVLHAVWLTAAWWLFDSYCDLGTLLRLLSADPRSQNAAIANIADHANSVTEYFGSMVVGAYLIPAGLRFLITSSRLDRHGALCGRFFRFNKAPWYYLLTGADFTKEEQPDLIYVSAIVNVAGNAVLYRGILDEFFVEPDGKLDRMVLQDVTRRPISADKGVSGSLEADLDSRFYGIDGDYFVLRYSEAITLNIQYIKYLPAEDDVNFSDHSQDSLDEQD